MTFENTTDDELTQLWHKQARDMSYLNAAEGESWYKERVAREACALKLSKLRIEISLRGLTLPIITL